LPETYSPIAELTHGGASVGATVADSTATAAAPALQPPAAKVRARERQHPRQSHVALHTPAAPLLPVAQVGETDATPEQAVVAAPDDAQTRYAAREEQAPKQGEFRGGAVIIIGAGVLLIVTGVAVLLLFMSMCHHDSWW
jgi:hypothetical protein